MDIVLTRANTVDWFENVSVGGATEAEVKEKKMRYEDALSATRATVEEGILPRGGVALVRASSQCDASKLNDDERTGYHIVLRACRAPLSWIAENAGQDGSLVSLWLTSRRHARRSSFG